MTSSPLASGSIPTATPTDRRSTRATTGIRLLNESESHSPSLSLPTNDNTRPKTVSKKALESEIRKLEDELQCLRLETQLRTLQTEKANLLQPPEPTISTKTATPQPPPPPPRDSISSMLGSSSTQQNGTKGKPLRINDFIWDCLFDMGQDTKPNTDKPDKVQQDISLEQWGYSNMAIMDKLIKTNALGGSGVQGYIKYTKDIFRLAHKYTWKSVFRYDFEYRIKQFEEGFAWGTYRPDIHDFTLEPKPQVTSQKQTRTRARGPFLPNGREICRRFNNDNCYSSDCRLAHNCSVCLSNQHSARYHDPPSSNVNPNRPPGGPAGQRPGFPFSKNGQ